jgi:DNA-3-methyladenine glycosylase I
MWAVQHPELLDYHDVIWGSPTYEDRKIFAAYAQCIMHAGLLWTAMLKKRPVFAQAFEQWDIAKVAAYDEREVERLMIADGMMHNFVKINCVIYNARQF